MKTPMRLVKKMDYALNAALWFIVLAGAVGFGLAGNHNHSNVVTPTLVVLWGAFAFSLACFFLLLGFFFKCWTRRRDAWRDHVKGWGVPAMDLLAKMRGTPSGKEVYTIEQARILATTCVDRIGAHLFPPFLRDIRKLERTGWIYLTFDRREDHEGEVIGRPTEQAWATIDAMCPRDWSPEDFISHRVACNAN